MTTPLKSEAILVIDLGITTTRALLFDIVEGQYSFIGVGSSPSTFREAYSMSDQDSATGVLHALEKLQRLLDNELVGINGDCQVTESSRKATSEFNGENEGAREFLSNTSIINIDSSMPLMKVLLVGLSEEISLNSLKLLAGALGLERIEAIHLNDGKKMEERLETVLRFRPEFVLVAGGTENSEVVDDPVLIKMIQPVAVASRLLPERDRPLVLFAGKTSLQERIREIFQNSDQLQFAPNIRPSLEHENIEDAADHLPDMYSKLRSRQLYGLDRLRQKTGENWMPVSIALRRAVRFLSRAHPAKKCVLAVDASIFGTIITFACEGRIQQGVFSSFGGARGLDGLFTHLPLEEIHRWSGLPLSENLMREYISNRAVNPASVPYTMDEIAIEQAVARVVMQRSIENFSIGAEIGRDQAVEPLIATGNLYAYAVDPAQIMLMYLDGLQPAGITTMILDTYNILPALGAIAPKNPIATVQILESTAFQHLGTVISPVGTVGSVNAGTPILRIRMELDDGNTFVQEILQGSLTVFPVKLGQSAQLHLQPLRNFDVGMGGPGKGGNLRVVGGSFGLVVDARGRPLRLPDDPYKRQELFHLWHKVLAG